MPGQNTAEPVYLGRRLDKDEAGLAYALIFDRPSLQSEKVSL